MERGEGVRGAWLLLLFDIIRANEWRAMPELNKANRLVVVGLVGLSAALSGALLGMNAGMVPGTGGEGKGSHTVKL